MKSEQGSASVELAFSIPLLLFLFALMAQLGLVMLDQLAVTQAARESVRVAAVSSSRSDITRAAQASTRLDRARTTVKIGARPGADGLVRVTVTYQSRIGVPFTERTLLRPVVSATSAMAVEG